MWRKYSPTITIVAIELLVLFITIAVHQLAMPMYVIGNN